MMDIRRCCPILLLPLMLLPASCTLVAGAGSGASQAPEPALVSTVAPTPFPDMPPESCPVTLPPAEPFIPPHPETEYRYEGYVWYGTPELWTDIPVDGRWHSLPYSEGQGYGNKVVFWNETYDWRTEQRPALTLSGHRLDGDAPDFVTDHATNGYHDKLGAFILTGAEIPTLGCWELTARYRKSELTFVVWVTN